MRRQDREASDPLVLERIIRRALVCRVAMCEGSRPYVVPVCFGFEGGALYFHCAAVGRKLDILRANPNVCVEFDIDVELVVEKPPCGCSMRYRSVIGEGRAEILGDPAAKREGLAAIMRQYGLPVPDFPKAAVAGTVVVRVVFDSLNGKQSRLPSL